MDRARDERGTVLIAAMVIMAFLVLVSAAALREGVNKSRSVDVMTSSRQSMLVAESALDTAIMEMNRRTDTGQALTTANDGIVGTDAWTLADDANGNLEPDFGESGVAPLTLTGTSGEYFTYVVGLGSDGLDNDNDGTVDGSSEQGYVAVVAKCRMAGQTEVREVEAVLRSVAAPPHPIFSDNYAIYAGNYSQDGSGYDDYELSFGGQHAGDADNITGLIHANGDIKFTGSSGIDDLDGDGNEYNECSATGKITGGGIHGHDNADAIAPPNIAAMDYPNIADYTISYNSSSDPNRPTVRKRGCYGYATTYDTSDPRHIFTDEDYRHDLGYLDTHHDNRNFFFADLPEGNNDGNISIHPDGNDKIYFVDGNLWVEAGAYHYRYYNAPADGARITIVVRGNVYMCDDFWLGNSGNPSQGDSPGPISNNPDNGLAIIAIADGESYTDVNGNDRYDEGEPILSDDGVPGYQGCQEGSGNVYYGDPNTGPVGDSQVFFYAENNFDEYCLDQNGRPLDIGIQGLMSAGNQVRINRDFGGQHAQMIVGFDGRLADGSLVLPGLPRSGGGGDDPVGPWAVVSWRDRTVVGPHM